MCEVEWHLLAVLSLESCPTDYFTNIEHLKNVNFSKTLVIFMGSIYNLKCGNCQSWHNQMYCINKDETSPYTAPKSSRIVHIFSVCCYWFIIPWCCAGRSGRFYCTRFPSFIGSGLVRLRPIMAGNTAWTRTLHCHRLVRAITERPYLCRIQDFPYGGRAPDCERIQH